MNQEDKTILESSRAREIVREILDFGVNDYQIKKIIKFLSLELEDRNLMKELVTLIEGEEEEITSNGKPRLQL